MAGPNNEALVEFVLLEVERLFTVEVPRLNNGEVEKRVFCRLDYPFFFALNVFRSRSQQLWLRADFAAFTFEFFDLRNGAPAHLEAVVVGVYNVLLLKHKYAVNRQRFVAACLGLLVLGAFWDVLWLLKFLRCDVSFQKNLQLLARIGVLVYFNLRHAKLNQFVLQLLLLHPYNDRFLDVTGCSRLHLESLSLLDLFAFADCVV